MILVMSEVAIVCPFVLKENYYECNLYLQNFKNIIMNVFSTAFTLLIYLCLNDDVKPVVFNREGCRVLGSIRLLLFSTNWQWNMLSSLGSGKEYFAKHLFLPMQISTLRIFCFAILQFDNFVSDPSCGRCSFQAKTHPQNICFQNNPKP